MSKMVLTRKSITNILIRELYTILPGHPTIRKGSILLWLP